MHRFEDFLEPKSFRDTVAALQWMEHKDAVALFTYESIYRFVQPLFNTRRDIVHSRTRLAKQAEAPLSIWEPTPRKENNDTGDSNENVIRPETEARYGAVYGDIQPLRDMIQQELTTVLIPKRAGVRERDCNFRKELNKLVPAEMLEAYHHGSRNEQDDMLRDLFAAAMGTDRAHLHADIYTDDMRRIRLLSLLPSFNDLSDHEEDLNTVIDLTALVATRLQKHAAQTI
ncbi:unnamed protein product [Alternaria sp. RS040]